MQYTQEVIDFLEMSYGKNMLSPGGNILDLMFSNCNLKNKKILDVGSGLGGVAINIAKNIKCEIIGIDVEDLVIKTAEENLKKEILIGNVKFINCKDIEEIKETNFDIVFSKESILHVKNKNNLFKNVYDKTKEGGEVIILDWFHREKKYSKEMEIFLKFDGLQMYLMETEEYIDILKKVGFKDIKYEDYTKIICEETRSVLNKAKTEISYKLKERFGKEYYDKYCLSSWEQQINLMAKKEIIVGKIKAKK
jgi:cyclopropane fatty-acyl-phospholipid synthase-like methyltransferase